MNFTIQPKRDRGLDDAASIREAMQRMVRCASEATESLGRRIENGTLDDRTEAEELCEALERLQALSLEVSEELDAYQAEARPLGGPTPC